MRRGRRRRRHPQVLIIALIDGRSNGAAQAFLAPATLGRTAKPVELHPSDRVPWAALVRTATTEKLLIV